MSFSRSGGEPWEVKVVPEPGRRTAIEAKLGRVPSGIRGPNEIMCRGLPRGRRNLASGGPGCGRTHLAMEFVAREVEELAAHVEQRRAKREAADRS